MQRLQQILINLLSNANKFTEQGCITLGIEINKGQDCVYFSVTDTGRGIPEDKQKKVFERFENWMNTCREPVWDWPYVS